MNRCQSNKLMYFRIVALIFAAASSIALAQPAKVQGMIKARSGATMTVQSADSSSIVVLLTDKTEVGQIQGVLKVRHKEMSMAALIPGLEVQIEGEYNESHQLTANSVKFQGNDLERAQSIQAGLHETQGQATRNREQLETQGAALEAQGEKIASNRAAIKSAINRFGQLDDYYILDEVTVLFGSGKVEVAPQYKPQVLALATKAKTIEGYIIQVVGYASSSGSVALNQKLSEERAANVSNLLLQDGDIPLTNILAPGAMGESRQIGDDKSEEAEAQNRRVVVRVLQNKGIAGLAEAK